MTAEEKRRRARGRILKELNVRGLWYAPKQRAAYLDGGCVCVIAAPFGRVAAACACGAGSCDESGPVFSAGDCGSYSPEEAI